MQVWHDCGFEFVEMLKRDTLQSPWYYVYFEKGTDVEDVDRGKRPYVKCPRCGIKLDHGQMSDQRQGGL